MVEKTFKVMCSHREYLTQDTIAHALLNQVTLKDQNPKVFFAVVEADGDGESVSKECASVSS